MSVKSIPQEHPHLPRHAKVGILLVNLGTPAGTDFASMRRYLREFLSDKRVIELPAWRWLPILYGIVLNRRPAKSGAAYERIWLKDDADGSPLLKYTKQQTEKLQKSMAPDITANKVYITWAMRYGKPNIASRLQEMMDEGCNRLLLLPLYPQYAAATTATVQDQVFKWMLKQRWQPALRTVAPWHDHPIYIEALASKVKKAHAENPFKDLLVSFHGIPERYFENGDPYHCHCMKTARLLREHLNWDEAKYHVAFQSRFGPEEWLKPYTDETIERLAREGVKNLGVIAPGFISDCLETLDELNIEGRGLFVVNGGENFTYIPCLNADEEGMKVIETLIKENMWL